MKPLGYKAKFENPGKNKHVICWPWLVHIGKKTVPEVLSMTRSHTHYVECTNICKWPVPLAGQL